jgi:hypothetical protein
LRERIAAVGFNRATREFDGPSGVVGSMASPDSPTNFQLA